MGKCHGGRYEITYLPAIEGFVLSILGYPLHDAGPFVNQLVCLELGEEFVENRPTLVDCQVAVLDGDICEN